MAAATAPYQSARLASLFLSFVFGIVGLALNVDALVKGNEEKDRLQGLVPTGTVVNIDTHDAVTVGGVVAGFSAALGVFSLLFLTVLLAALFSRKSASTSSTRTLPLQGIVLSILTLGLFGALVAMTDLVANREAKVSATVGRVALPPAIVHSVEKAIGATSVYHEIPYLRLAVILPWIAFLFGAISSILTLLAASSARARDIAATQDNASDSTGAELNKDKQEHVIVAQTAV